MLDLSIRRWWEDEMRDSPWWPDITKSIEAEEMTTPTCVPGQRPSCNPNTYYTLQLLLESKPPCYREGMDLTIFEASAVGDVISVQRLLRGGQAPDVRDVEGNTPLILCMTALDSSGDSRANRLEIVRLLLLHGADPSVVDRDDATPLMHACQHGLVEEVELLLAILNNAKYAMKPNKLTALHSTSRGFLKPLCLKATNTYLVACPFSRIAEILLKHGADINCRDGYYRTPLHWAMRCFEHSAHQHRLVSTLLELGADPYLRDINGCYPMTRNNEDILELSGRANLLTSGASKRLERPRWPSGVFVDTGAARRRHCWLSGDDKPGSRGPIPCGKGKALVWCPQDKTVRMLWGMTDPIGCTVPGTPRQSYSFLFRRH